MRDDDFLSAFENCSLPFEQWTHRAHVRVAYMYVSSHDLDAAIDRMRSSIKAYNKTTDTPEAIDRGYHETITQAFMRLVFSANRQTGPHGTSDKICEVHRELLTKAALRRFYSRDRIMTMEAKAGFVEPDRYPLPITAGDSITISHVEGGESLEEPGVIGRDFAIIGTTPVSSGQECPTNLNLGCSFVVLVIPRRADNGLPSSVRYNQGSASIQRFLEEGAKHGLFVPILDGVLLPDERVRRDIDERLIVVLYERA